MNGRATFTLTWINGPLSRAPGGSWAGGDQAYSGLISSFMRTGVLKLQTSRFGATRL